ncbi:putative 6-phosphofructo-2-kinase [Smittium culicis]|uniref:Putative 6-phosphofructo-2-kinase n=1 Tax=Smittium culicis TaxID=133412 RepID=A0A1R1YPF1_9FUNG|nr:putative 6-phosphofructo-2-kinase [Smittium culicis]
MDYFQSIQKNEHGLQKPSLSDLQTSISPLHPPVPGSPNSLSPSLSANPSTSNSVSSLLSLGEINKRNDLYQGLIDLDAQVKLVIVMVGLPARGKSYIVKKLKRYLSWLGLNVKIFNVGDRRRKLPSIPQNSPQPLSTPSLNHGLPALDDLHRHDSSFFDPNNALASKRREEVAMDVLDEIIHYLHDAGQVAIHDATNSTISRRENILNKLQPETGIKTLFVESICNDPEIINKNILMKLKSPDYIGVDPKIAEADFRQRLKNYEAAYETLGTFEEAHFVQYLKIIDVGRKITTCNINGFLEGQCVFYLMNMNLEPRLIYLTRHGESIDNVYGKIGGDASLSESGKKFSKALAKFIENHQQNFQKIAAEKRFENCATISNSLSNSTSSDSKLKLSRNTTPKSNQLEIWTSMLKRTIQTAKPFDSTKYKPKRFSVLNELYAGLCEGMTYQKIPKLYPREFADRTRDKLFTRYPGIHGESYVDVIHRLQYIIVELERIYNSVLIVTHRAVARTLLSYFLDINIEDMPHLNVPIGHVFVCEPKHFGNDFEVYKYDESNDTFIKTNPDIIYP